MYVSSLLDPAGRGLHKKLSSNIGNNCRMFEYLLYRQTDINVYLTKINKIYKIIFTKIAVERPPLRLYIVALVEATLFHVIIYDKHTRSKIIWNAI